MRKPVERAALAALFVLGACAAIAQANYPAKAIRYIVPFPAGGPLDIVARAIGLELTKSWGQPVIVDNRPGAGGNIGADLVAKAPPDGYTILMGAVSTHAINVALYSKLPYDPVRDFAPVTLITSVPNVLVVHPSPNPGPASSILPPAAPAAPATSPANCSTAWRACR